jgi:hypothetical protein
MHANNQKILLSLPRELVRAIDITTTEKQVSRTAFIRESLLRNLRYYNTYERGICFPRGEVGLATPSDDLNLSDCDAVQG